jgi:ATP-dependent Lon protease
VPIRIVNAGGSSDNRDFSGTARGWNTAHPARVIEILRETEVANPIVLLDEIDKAGGGDRNGRITATLLTMLEPETRARFYDEALTTNVDLSHVNWILTANDVQLLGRPLLSRLRVVRMPAPPVTAARKIVETVLKDLAARYGWPKGAMPELEPEVHAALIDAMSKGASPRNISVMIEQVLAIEFKRRRSGLN